MAGSTAPPQPMAGSTPAPISGSKPTKADAASCAVEMLLEAFDHYPSEFQLT